MAIFILGATPYNDDDNRDDYYLGHTEREAQEEDKHVYIHLTDDDTYMECGDNPAHLVAKKLNHQKLLDYIMEYLA